MAMIPAFPTVPEYPAVLSPMQTFGKLSGLYGFGCGCSQLDESGNCLDPEPCGSTAVDVSNLPTVSTGLNPIYETIPTGTLTLPSTSAPASPATGAPASPSGITAAQQAALAQQLISGGFTVTKEAIAQPGMVIGPNGQISYQNPGYPVGASSALTTPSSSTFMLLAVAGLGAIFLLNAGRGR